MNETSAVGDVSQSCTGRRQTGWNGEMFFGTSLFVLEKEQGKKEKGVRKKEEKARPKGKVEITRLRMYPQEEESLP